MNIKTTAKKVCEWGIKLYLASYLAVSAHVGYDFFKYNLPRIERRQTVQVLEVYKYKINLNGREKQLTLAGEIYNYTQNEHEIANALVNENQHFASECGSDPFKDVSIGTLMYLSVVALPATGVIHYGQLGSGRWYDSISSVAEERGYKVHALEKVDDTFSSMSYGEKLQLAGMSILSAFIAPLAYYSEKDETTWDASQSANVPFKESLLDNRNIGMANSIVDLLRKDEIDQLLAAVGRAHLEGVISNLSQQVELQEIK